MDQAPLLRAFRDKVNPEVLARDFAPTFDPQAMTKATLALASSATKGGADAKDPTSILTARFQALQDQINSLDERARSLPIGDPIRTIIDDQISELINEAGTVLSAQGIPGKVELLTQIMNDPETPPVKSEDIGRQITELERRYRNIVANRRAPDDPEPIRSAPTEPTLPGKEVGASAPPVAPSAFSAATPYKVQSFTATERIPANKTWEGKAIKPGQTYFQLVIPVKVRDQWVYHNAGTNSKMTFHSASAADDGVKWKIQLAATKLVDQVRTSSCASEGRKMVDAMAKAGADMRPQEEPNKLLTQAALDFGKHGDQARFNRDIRAAWGFPDPPDAPLTPAERTAARAAKKTERQAKAKSVADGEAVAAAEAAGNPPEPVIAHPEPVVAACWRQNPWLLHPKTLRACRPARPRPVSGSP